MEEDVRHHHVETDATSGAQTPVETRRLTSVELFAGAGGLALGCELAGFRSLATLEMNQWACDTIRENKAAGHRLVKDWQVSQGDVRDFEWTALPKDVDLLSGGPPCQPFSLGGRHQAAEDPRDMFPTTAHAIAAVRPRAFMIENVRGLMRPTFAKYFEYIKLRLEMPENIAAPDEEWLHHLTRLKKARARAADGDLRYNVTAKLVNAADYGVPQHRHRVFIIGFRADQDVKWEFPKPRHTKDSLLHAKWVTGDYWEEHRVASKDRPDRPESLPAQLATPDSPDKASSRWQTVRDALRGLPEPMLGGTKGFHNHELKPGARSYYGHTGSDIDLPSKALKAGAHGVPGGENMLRRVDGSIRYYSVRESARIQTFPDDYVLHGSWGEAMRQLGNAVPVDLATAVARSVYEAMEGSRES